MTIDEIYEVIANGLVACISTEVWDKAVLYVQGDNTYVEITGIYECKGKTFNLNTYNIDTEVSFALMELHEITTAENSNQWNRATFTLFHDGNFNMEFQWDQELDDEINSLS